MNHVYRALSDPTRRRVLELLRDRDMTAGELAGHFDLASCLRRLGDMQGSLDSLRLAVSLAPEFQSGWNDLGLTYLSLENWDDAEECFRRVLAIEPGSSRAVQQLAYVQQKKTARIRG